MTRTFATVLILLATGIALAGGLILASTNAPTAVVPTTNWCWLAADDSAHDNSDAMADDSHELAYALSRSTESPADVSQYITDHCPQLDAIYQLAQFDSGQILNGETP